MLKINHFTEKHISSNPNYFTSRGIFHMKNPLGFYVEEAQHIRRKNLNIPGLSLDYEIQDPI